MTGGGGILGVLLSAARRHRARTQRTCCLNSPTLVAPWRLDSLLLSGARMRLMWPNRGGVKLSAW